MRKSRALVQEGHARDALSKKIKEIEGWRRYKANSYSPSRSY